MRSSSSLKKEISVLIFGFFEGFTGFPGDNAMPFIKKSNTQSSLSSTPPRSVFVGRANELLFFIQHILKPEEPVHNILSIWGQAGVGKTTLLLQFISQTRTAEFKEYCLTALVDERQATPASMMEKFAQQLPLSKQFEKALSHYKEALNLPTISRPVNRWQETMVTKAPDVAGALFEGLPVAGPLLREGAKVATEHLLDRSQTLKGNREAVKLNSPLETLTRAFIAELNHVAATKVTLPATGTKRERRILLFFDTLEQIANETVPWLLDDVLEMEISPNIVLIVAGRDSIERSGPDGPKYWLPYYDSQTLHAIPLNNFTQEETSAYLMERGVTSREQSETIWHLSQGLPLYLGFLTSNTQGRIDPTKDVVDNFLRWIPKQEETKRQLALDTALFTRPFNLDDLEAFPYLTEGDRPALYEWLLRQPFVRASSLEGRYIYHDLAQELFCRHLYQHSPKAYYAVRKALAEHYRRLLEHLQTVQDKHIYGPTNERLEVMLALVTQCFFLPDEASHLQALPPCLAILEYEDEEQVKALTKTLQGLVSSSIHLSTHACQTIQGFLQFMEATPRLHLVTNQKQREEWLESKDNMLKLVLHSSSPSSELLSSLYDYCGWGYMRFRDYQQGRTCFERVLELHPSSGTAYNGLGHVHYFLKEYDQAILAFSQGQRLIPHHPHLYHGRALAYLKIAAYQQALSDWDHALQLDWRLIRGYHCRAIVYTALKKHQKALADLDHLLEVVPGHPSLGQIHLLRGCIYLWLKDLRQATSCFMLGYEMASTGNLFLLRRNWSAITRDLFLWAREWSMMCQTYPDSQTVRHLETIASGDGYTAYVCRGVICWLHKEFEQALTAFQHAATLRYDPDWREFGETFWQEWDAHFWLGMTYLALDQEEEARVAIENALTLQMPPILLKPLSWFEQEKPKLHEQLVQPLFDVYDVL
jgi:tetratricopeptide (TPR) repeat protein